MRYVVDSTKSVEQAAADLEQAVAKHGFGVLHVHDLKGTLHSKGIDFPNECRIFEVCNPQKALEVLSEDMEMNMALPCRISVYEENGKTRIGTILPTAILGMLSNSDKLREVAREVEDISIRIINDAA